MTKRINLNEDELRAKRVYTKLERASKSPYNYTKKINKGIKRPIVKNTPRGKEVVIKITGNSKNFQKWKAHFNYVTRKGELEVVESELYKYQGKEELKQVKFYMKLTLQIWIQIKKRLSLILRFYKIKQKILN
jgi:hypothetical protein